ncbi:MAG: MlaD family protein [Thermoleophilaceae bacterium]
MKVAIRKHLSDMIAIVVLAAIGLGTAYYILQQQGFRIPLIQAAPFEIKAAFSEAGGVKPGQNQSVRMAGVRIGEISGVELQDGRAVVTMAIDQEYADRIGADATALLRPRTGLEDMFVDLAPGSERAPRIEEEALIRIGDTLPDVDSDQILNQLDTRTRDYLSLLVNGGAGGVENRTDDLRDLYRRLEPLHRDLERVNGAVAGQRRKLRRLVHDYGQLTGELAQEPQQLTSLVRSSNEVFDALASQDDDISEAVRRLPGALRQTESALVRVDSFADLLGPTLESLRPAFRELDDANASLRELASETTGTIRDDIRPFVRRAQPYLDDLRPAARDLAGALPDLSESFGQLNRFVNMAAFNPGGAEPVTSGRVREEGYLFWLAWVAHNTNLLFSASDASGPFRRTAFALDCNSLRELLVIEPLLAEAFGLTNVLGSLGLCPSGGTP